MVTEDPGAPPLGRNAPDLDGFQVEVHEYLLAKDRSREVEEPPQWEGDPETLQEYQGLLQS